MFWTKKTKSVIDFISEEPLLGDFVMSGGSALSYYLHHRLSEDIDLFSPDEILPNNYINIVMKSFKKNHSVKETDFLNSRLGLIMNIYFFDGVKIDFAALGNNYIIKNKVKYKDNFYIASEEVVIAMKMEAVSDRNVFRDYYDVYSILKKYSMSDIVGMSKNYNKDFNYKLFFKKLMSMSAVKEDVLNSKLEPVYNVSKKDMKMYFNIIVKEYLTNEVDFHMNIVRY